MTAIQFLNIPALPLSLIGGEARRTLDVLEQPFLVLDNDPNSQTRAEILLGHWLLALHWLIKKKWFPNYKLDRRNAIVRDFEPFGDLLLSILELCIQSYGATKHSASYASGYIWFQAVANEMKNRDFAEIFQPDGHSSKTSDLAERRNVVKQLRDYVNFSDPDKTPHLWRLLEASIEQAKTFPGFDRKYWRGERGKNKQKGFIHAYTAWVGELDKKKWKNIVCEKGKLFVRDGQGKALTPMPVLTK